MTTESDRVAKRTLGRPIALSSGLHLAKQDERGDIIDVRLSRHPFPNIERRDEERFRRFDITLVFQTRRQTRHRGRHRRVILPKYGSGRC